MRVRHRIPSVFSLAMVDVFCCALGCVILLWLINLREASDIEDVSTRQRQLTAEELERVQEQSRQTRDALASAERDRQDAGNLVLDLFDQLDQANSEKDEKKKALDKQIVVVGELKGRLTRAEGRVLALTDEVKSATDKTEKLSAQIVVLSQQLDKATRTGVDANAVAALVPKLKTDLKTAIDQRDEAESRLKVARTRLDEALKDMTRLENQVKELQSQVATLQAEEKRLRDLVGKREAEIRSLREQFKTPQAQGEQRFAGLPLTGRNVVFLVDKSGSMVATGPNEPAPDKWNTVCTSVARVMDSLPDLEHFQVIVFSDEPRFLLGKAGSWITFDKATSAGEVRTRLLDLLRTGEVDGGTNLYDPFDLAFRFRKNAVPLDTIYLFSDGLPNSGKGVPVDEIIRLWNGRKNGIDADRMELGRRLGDHLRNQLRRDWNRPEPGQKFGPVRINALGFYYESADLGAFLWSLARENDGGFVGMSKP